MVIFSVLVTLFFILIVWLGVKVAEHNDISPLGWESWEDELIKTNKE